MVEASIILPVVILSSAVIVFICIAMYGIAVVECSMHMSLRESAGRISSTVFRGDEKGRVYERAALYSFLNTSEEIEKMQTAAEQYMKNNPFDLDVEYLQGDYEGLGLHPRLKIYGSKVFDGFHFISKGKKKDLKAQWSLKDGAQFVRNTDMLLEGIGWEGASSEESLQ